MANIHEEPTNTPQRAEVMQGEWRSLRDGGVIFTRRMATCIGLSVYDSAEKLAILGHFDGVSISDGAIDAMVDATDELSNPEQTKIWMGGGTLLDPELAASRDPDIDAEIVEIANHETQLFRERVLHSVAGLLGRGAMLTTHWLEGAVYIDYALDVGTGEEQVTLSDD